MTKFHVAIDGQTSEASGDELLQANDDTGVRWFAHAAAVGDEYRIGGGAAPLVVLERVE